MAMLTDSPINLALHDKGTVLFNVNEIDLDIAALDVHNGKGLLPVKCARRTAIEGFAVIHEVSYLNAV